MTLNRAAPQLELFRPSRAHHRGGRPTGVKPRVRHRPRPDFAERHPGLVTLKVVPGLRTLRDVRIVRELERTLGAACEQGDFRVAHYSIQPDHLHLLVEAGGRHALGRGMQSIGARVARAVNRVLGRKGRVLLDRFHLRILRTPREVRNALTYVLNNARKHLGARAPRNGSVDAASSGRWFHGWREGVVASARSPAPIARARTWLLRVGWRRHGLLDPSEVPGLRAQRRDRAPPSGSPVPPARR
ncbi:MAG TPA: transposase [Myxococcota bacterium]|nr:transposase [Myxococcota bacterium]